jgi:DNA processing protein
MSAESSDADLLAELRLSLVPGVGPRIRGRLVERFGSARAALDAPPSELRRVEGVGPKVLENLVAAASSDEAETELAVCRERAVGILPQSHPSYPPLLRQIYDPPGLLFVRGTLQAQDGLAVAIVGTRHPTQYGLRQAARLAESLSRAGLTITSGLARGIDAAAHRGAMAAGGRTVAVLAGGVVKIYPPEHEQLAAEVAARGAVVSEVPSDCTLQGGMFPQRNRIISGLSLGVIVVEAGDRSGALITARHAMEQGREVFAVPGRVEDRSSHGCHQLIRDGAKLVQSADDVLEELGPLFQPAQREDGTAVHHPAELQLNELEQEVLAAIASDPTTIDQVAAATGLPLPQVLSTISVLEMRRLIRRLSGSSVVRL